MDVCIVLINGNFSVIGSISKEPQAMLWHQPSGRHFSFWEYFQSKITNHDNKPNLFLNEVKYILKELSSCHHMSLNQEKMLVVFNFVQALTEFPISYKKTRSTCNNILSNTMDFGFSLLIFPSVSLPSVKISAICVISVPISLQSATIFIPAS